MIHQRSSSSTASQTQPHHPTISNDLLLRSSTILAITCRNNYSPVYRMSCVYMLLPCRHHVAAIMSTSEPGGSTVIHVADAPVTDAPPPPPTAATTSSYATAPTASAPPLQRKAGSIPFLLRSGAEGFRRCLAMVDLLLRVAAFGPTLAAAISTGTADERLSVFTQFFQFHARFDDFPAFTFFMVGNAIAAGYLVLTLPFSAVGIIRPKATGVRLLLLLGDTIMVGLLTASAAAAAAIVHLAHSGNRRANWVPICMQFHGFCQRTSGAVVASFLAVLVLLVLVVMGACAIRRR